MDGMGELILVTTGDCHFYERAHVVLDALGAGAREIAVDSEAATELAARGIPLAFLPVLTDGEHLVYLAGTAVEGLAVAERVKPGLIVPDLMLPDRSGEDICREIRERSDVPTLMLTADDDGDARIHLHRVCGRDHSARPRRRRSSSFTTTLRSGYIRKS